MNPPRVFISYSHDSATHKMWVLDFATTLRNRGVDAVLDQWDLKPGDDLPHFMETQLEAADYVLMVCTSRYVEKANSGEGGVGYEKMIVTSSLLNQIDVNNVIPVIRQSGSKEIPTFLKTKVFTDLSKDDELEYGLDELLRTLLDSPLFEKPEIGINPFTPLKDSRPDRVSDGIKEVMIAVSNCYENWEFNSILKTAVIHQVTMHRLTLDRYIKQAVQQGLLATIRDNRLMITDDGIEYLVAHGIISE